MGYREPQGEEEDEEDEAEEDEEEEEERPRTRSSSRRRSVGPAVPQPQGNDVNAMIQLEMLKTIKKMRRSSSSSESDDGDDDVPGQHLRSGAAGFKGVHKLRKKIMRNPDSIVKGYLKKVKDQLSVTSEQQHWSMREYAKLHVKTFGKMRGGGGSSTSWARCWTCGRSGSRLPRPKRCLSRASSAYIR